MNKEQVYDAEIEPLMAQILAVCKREKIAMVAQFAIPTEEDPDLLCTSCLTTDEFDPPQAMREAMKILYRREPQVVALTITTGPAPQRAIR